MARVKRDKAAYGAPTFAWSIDQVRPVWKWIPADPRLDEPSRAGLIRVGPRLIPLVRQLWSRVVESLDDAFRRQVQPVGEEAFGKWPVRTGFSKSKLVTLVFSTRTGIVMRFANLAPYAAKIRGGHTRTQLLERPSARVQRALLGAIRSGLRGR